jgi:nitroreductase
MADSEVNTADSKLIGAELQALIVSRSTVHDFSSEPLPEGALDRAIAAGLTAPNHRMTEPWRFVRVGLNARERLAQVQARLKDKGRAPSAESLARAREKMLASAELVVVCRVVHPDAGIAREDYAAIACAVQNISLSLWAEGIGSKWSTGGVTTDGETYQTLGLNSGETEIVGFLWLGYAKPNSLAKKPPRRLTVSQVLTEVP